MGFTSHFLEHGLILICVNMKSGSCIQYLKAVVIVEIAQKISVVGVLLTDGALMQNVL